MWMEGQREVIWERDREKGGETKLIEGENEGI